MHTILVVEGYPAMRKVIRVLLQREGYTVLEAGDGRSALQLQSAHAPDLILTELALPDICGVELARRLRAQAGGAGVPIIALSDPQCDVPSSADALFAARLVKPINSDRLKQAVRVCLSHGGGERDRAPERETRQMQRMHPKASWIPVATAMVSEAICTVGPYWLAALVARRRPARTARHGWR